MMLRQITPVRRVLLAASFALISGPSLASPPPATARDTDADKGIYLQHLHTLANPYMEGRLAGSPGMELAKDYVEYYFDRFGLVPAFPEVQTASSGGQVLTPRATYRQSFEFTRLLGHSGRSARDADADAPEDGGPGVVSAENLGALLPGAGPLANEYVVIGAHLDHVGRGNFGSRRGRGEIHPGADDNASGSAALLLLAQRLAENHALDGYDNRRSVLFLAFSGEESGLHGSRHYVDEPIAPPAAHKVMINFDMIGRAGEDGIDVSGIGSGVGMRDWMTSADVPEGLRLNFMDNAAGNSDHASFFNGRIPVAFVSLTNLHDDYHTSGDMSWKISPETPVAVVDWVEPLVLDAITREDMFAFNPEAKLVTAGGVGAIKVRFGIMPASYADEFKGVGVGGVTPGTPAEKAGLQKGDRLVAWDGERIDDIQDWMKMLSTQEPGDVVTITILREGEERDIDVTLEGRG